MFKGFKFLLRYSWKFSKQYVICIFALQIISSLIPLLQVVLPKFILDELVGRQRMNVLILYVAMLVGYNLVGGLLVDFLRGKCFTTKGVVFTRFQSMLAERLARCDYEQLENPEFLDIKERAGKFLYANGQGFGVVLDSAVNILGKAFVFIGLMTIIVTLNIWIVLLFVGLVMLNAFVEGRVKENYVKWDMEKVPIERKTSYFLDLVENVSYGKEIRIYNLSSWLVKKITAHLKLSDEFYIRQTKSYNKSNYFNTFTRFLREVISYGYLCMKVVKREIGIGDFTMYLAAIAQFSTAMNDVMESVLNIKQFSFYYDALEKYMNIPCKMREGEQLPLDETKFEIEFRNVSFKYEKSDTYALKNVNLKIVPGEKLAIVGENGAGKSTFVKLICRLYDPTEGAILLNGTDIRRFEYDSYMKILSVVFQDYKLFAFTVKDNIAFEEAADVTDEKIEDILIQSGFENRLRKLEKGVHSNIYRNFELDGFEPSGGEGQKLSLARALYKDSPVVILDEPTAALDPRSEYEIYQHFNQMVKGKTAIYISHRLASCRFCDRILVLMNGQIKEYGTHEELMNKGGIYLEMFHMQAQYYQE
jgi:ABC-type multidrug transport system, ATPase and permease components